MFSLNYKSIPVVLAILMFSSGAFGAEANREISSQKISKQSTFSNSQKEKQTPVKNKKLTKKNKSITPKKSRQSKSEKQNKKQKTELERTNRNSLMTKNLRGGAYYVHSRSFQELGLEQNFVNLAGLNLGVIGIWSREREIASTPGRTRFLDEVIPGLRKNYYKAAKSKGNSDGTFNLGLKADAGFSISVANSVAWYVDAFGAYYIIPAPRPTGQIGTGFVFFRNKMGLIYHHDRKLGVTYSRTIDSSVLSATIFSDAILVDALFVQMLSVGFVYRTQLRDPGVVLGIRW